MDQLRRAGRSVKWNISRGLSWKNLIMGHPWPSRGNISFYFALYLKSYAIYRGKDHSRLSSNPSSPGICWIYWGRDERWICNKLPQHRSEIPNVGPKRKWGGTNSAPRLELWLRTRISQSLQRNSRALNHFQLSLRYNVYAEIYRHSHRLWTN